MYGAIAKVRHCVSCGKEYTFCPNGVPTDVGKPTWMFICCCQECRDIDVALTNYYMGLLSLEDTVKVINGIDRNTHKFLDKIESQIDEILAKYEQENKNEKKAIITINEEKNPISDSKKESGLKTRFSKKRKNKE